MKGYTTIKKARKPYFKHNSIYAKKGDGVLTFPNVIEASHFAGVSPDHIYKCCNGKKKSASGYAWSYTPFPKYEEDNKTWKDILGYEGLYQVSSDGYVRTSHNGLWEYLSLCKSVYGYIVVTLHKGNGRKENKRVHRLATEEETKELGSTEVTDAFGNASIPQRADEPKFRNPLSEIKREETPQSIEIPFGAKDSELISNTITIPEGFTAEIKGNQVVLNKKEEKHQPEFCVEDWVVMYNPDTENYETAQVERFEKGTYYFSNGCSKNIGEKKMHLWTIQDAKDGDVLVDKEGNISIFKEIADSLGWYSYIYCDKNGNVFPPDDDCICGLHLCTGTVPTTKEQRDTLFKAMKEAGYEWDANKKALKHEFHPIPKRHIPEDSTLGKMLSERKNTNEIVDPEQKKSDQELTEFEKEFLRIYHHLKPSDFTDDGLAHYRKGIAEILELARKQFIEEACEFLAKWDKYHVCLEVHKDFVIEDFRKAMSNEK